MTTAQGSHGQIVIGEESTFNTQPAPASGYILPFISEGLVQNVGKGQSQVIRSNRNPIKPYRQNKTADGTINTELNPFMGLVLKHALGTVSSTGANPYTHTFKVGDLPTSLWIDKGFTDISKYFRFNGCRINSLNMSFAGEGGLVPLAIDIMGASMTTGTSAADASPTDNGHAPWENFEASIAEGG
ncbi:MAG: phage tail tube protein, partial [Desulfobulbales bacterium]